MHDIDTHSLHNAGNDAFATLRVWELLIDMPEHERQRHQYEATSAAVLGNGTSIEKTQLAQGSTRLEEAKDLAETSECPVGDLIQF